jgi:hypothetical protein
MAVQAKVLKEVAARGYAHPEVLVTTEWVAEHLDDPDVRIVESDEDVLLYEVGHVPGAVKIDWHTDLQDPLIRDYLAEEAFARLCSEKGIGRDTTVVFYGDKNNWWACYAFWVFKLFGHPDARVMDGGRAKWEAEGRPLKTDAPSHPKAQYEPAQRDDRKIRGGERPLEARGPGGRDVQAGGRAARDLRGGGRSEEGRRRDRVLSDRRAVEPHVVRADVSARVRSRAELRRLLDGVGEPGSGAGREVGAEIEWTDRLESSGWWTTTTRPATRGCCPARRSRCRGATPGAGTC